MYTVQYALISTDTESCSTDALSLCAACQDSSHPTTGWDGSSFVCIKSHGRWGVSWSWWCLYWEHYRWSSLLCCTDAAVTQRQGRRLWRRITCRSRESWSMAWSRRQRDIWRNVVEFGLRHFFNGNFARNLSFWKFYRINWNSVHSSIHFKVNMYHMVWSNPAPFPKSADML